MTIVRTLATLTLLLPALLACNGQGDTAAEAARDGAAPAEDSASGLPGPADVPVTSAGGDAVCLDGAPFASAGALPVEETGAADGPLEISALRWERHDGCERFVIDLARAGQGPARAAGPVDVDLIRALGVVRIRLEDAETVRDAATDARFEGPLARAAYAVRAPDGRGMYVDLHLAEPAEARALLLSDPARVVVDLRAGGTELPAPPSAGQRVVIVEPRAGPASYPLTVYGYARTFEANVVARLEGAGAPRWRRWPRLRHGWTRGATTPSPSRTVPWDPCGCG